MQQQPNKQNESGNVLFLILIAVALFAALSYAVTQSTRSGSGTTERETVLLNSAGLTQYPTSLRTAVVRMILAGIDVGEVGFDAPSSGGFGGASAANQVFHPNGGGAVYQEAPIEVMAANMAPNWTFNGNFEIPQIGQDGAGGNDVIAFLPGVTISVCRRLNEELGVPSGTATQTGVPDFDAVNADVSDVHVLGDAFPTTANATITNASNDFDGQPAACFYDLNFDAGNPAYIFYSVLLER
jgi:hypothetical protein